VIPVALLALDRRLEGQDRREWRESIGVLPVPLDIIGIDVRTTKTICVAARDKDLRDGVDRGTSRNVRRGVTA